MALPRRLKIGPAVYKVLIRPAESEELDNGQSAGVVLPDQQTIIINRDCAEAKRFVTLLHEVLHAILAPHSVRNEERLVSLLEEPLALFIADNPTFCQKLREATRKAS